MDNERKNCWNCKHYKGQKCDNESSLNFKSFQQTYWYCKSWEPSEFLVLASRKEQMVNEMVGLWVKEDAPDDIKNAVRDALMKQNFIV